MNTISFKFSPMEKVNIPMLFQQGRIYCCSVNPGDIIIYTVETVNGGSIVAHNLYEDEMEKIEELECNNTKI